MARYCLYCGPQFSDTTQFCPNCGRPTEKDFRIRPARNAQQEAELERLHRDLEETDELIRQLISALQARTEQPSISTGP